MKFFSYAEPTVYNASFNFIPDQLSGYAEGYRKAADHLVTEITFDPIDIDYLIYPLIFLYRHHLELRFKEFIRSGFAFSNMTGDFPKCHNLTELWTAARVHLESFVKPLSHEELSDIDNLVSELSSFDEDSFAFRYSEDKRGTKTLLGIDHINVKHLHQMITPTLDTLQRISYDFEDYFDSAPIQT